MAARRGIIREARQQRQELGRELEKDLLTKLSEGSALKNFLIKKKNEQDSEGCTRLMLTNILERWRVELVDSVDCMVGDFQEDMADLEDEDMIAENT